MSKSKRHISEVLRKTLAESGFSCLELERMTGVQRASSGRSAAGVWGLPLDAPNRFTDGCSAKPPMPDPGQRMRREGHEEA